MQLSILPYIFDEDGNIDYQAHAECGFSGLDLQFFTSDKYPQFNYDGIKLYNWCKEELKRANTAHIKINQLHSFWIWPPQKYDKDEKGREEEFVYYKRAIRAAHYLKCQYVAIHHRLPLELDDPRTNNETYRVTLSFMKRLTAYARKYKVTLCLENLPFIPEVFNVKNTLNIIKEVNSKYCQMCLDTGHENVTDHNVYQSIKEGKDYIKIFHVHDNDGKDDLHLFPGKGTINWKGFHKAIKEINFKGMISLETRPKGIDDYQEKKKALKALFTTTIDIISNNK